MKSLKKNIKTHPFSDIIRICREKEGFNAKTSLGKVNIRLRKKGVSMPQNITKEK